MIPINFPESNINFRPPVDMEGSCLEMHGYMGEVHGGVFDGTSQMIVAWQPSEEDIEKMKGGCPIFLSVMGALPPHRMSMSFDDSQVT